MSRQEIAIGNAAAHLAEAVRILCDAHGDVKRTPFSVVDSDLGSGKLCGSDPSQHRRQFILGLGICPLAYS